MIRRASRSVLVATALGFALGACSGGADDVKVGGQAVNGTDTVVTDAANALSTLSSETGINVAEAKCYLRLASFESIESGNETVPQSVDCLPVGFLGNSGFNTVTYTVMLRPDPERPKDLLVTLDADNPTLTTFNAGSDAFKPELPTTLAKPGEASIPDGYVLVDDQLVKSSDLEAAAADAVRAMQLDTSHDSSVKFTLADEPTCLFEARLDAIWCGPGVSLVAPVGEVYHARLGVPSIDINTYQRGGGGDESGLVVVGDGDWSPLGSEPGNLLDARGEPSKLPAIDTIDAPEIPTIEAGYFAEVDDQGGWLGSECFDVGRAAEFCDPDIKQHLEANPTTLRFTSGDLAIDALAFGDQTGGGPWSSVVDAERAADGERLIGLRVALKRNDQVADTTPLNAQIVVDGEVKGDFGNASGVRTFFLSAPTDATVSVVLQSDGNDQSLNISGESIERTTDRPELYLEPDTYTFSGDQSWIWNDIDRDVKVMNAGNRNEKVETQGWIVRDKSPVLPPVGTRFIQVAVDLGVFDQLNGPTNACSMSLLLADGTVIEPTDVGSGPCVTVDSINVLIRSTFAIAPDADVQAIRVNPSTIDEYAVPEIVIPLVST